jgi:hypothetical protein
MIPSLVIPIDALPNQTIQVTVAQQNCQVTLRQSHTGLYFDLIVSGVPVVVGRICRDRVPLVRAAYTGFIGDFAIIDTQGIQDPDYTSLGARYLLVYG